MTAFVFDARTVAPAVSIPEIFTRAHQMVEFGFSVFPLHGVWQDADSQMHCLCGNPGCGRNTGKHPATKNGLLDATRDPKSIESWWRARPACNVGARTDNILALDVDLDKAGDRSLSALEGQHGDLPRTWTSRTGGGGWHVFFSQPDGAPIGCSTGKIGSGLDVKGVGGYVVAPGSRHRSRLTYEWLPDRHPENTPLAQMPDWLVELCREARSTSARSSDELAQLVNSKVGEGMRNDTLVRVVGHIMWTGKVSPHFALKFAHLWNESQCIPPLADDEVVRIVDSICGRELLKRRPR